MTKPKPPILDPAQMIPLTLEQDITSVLEPLIKARTQAPIVRHSKYQNLQTLLPDDMPATGIPLDEVITEIRSLTDEHCRRNTHPGFFGYVASSGLPTDPLAHAMSATLNQNVVGYPGSPAGATMERTLVNWLKLQLGYPATAEGLLLSGGSIANTTAIAAALSKKFAADYRTKGLIRCAGSKRPKIICSQDVHFSVQRAAALLGIGTENIVTIGVDEQFRMRTDLLSKTLSQIDCPVCVIASAGTTLTGAIDPLDEIAELCAQQDVWLHVDAAYGGGALLCAELLPLFKGIEKANSVSMDLHKWFFMSLDGSMLLYRDPASARAMFYENSDYVTFPIDGPPEQHMFFHLGPELSRRFRALPFYMAFRHYGAKRLGRSVLHNVECAQYLAKLVNANPDLQLVAEPQLSICCFRFRPTGLDEETIDQINKKIRSQIEKEGEVFMSETNVNGRPVLRVCIINHGSRAEHIELLLERVLKIGAQYFRMRFRL
ncbi:MAG: pyridoxal phosphate-dependent decarboxylase family protein [Arenicellales bacterium WSBS_2016_MAG_OTU3]